MRNVPCGSTGIEIHATTNDIGETNQQYLLSLANGVHIVLPFQKGPIPANGVNGVTLESLIEVCADRLEVFQAGAFECAENALALDHLKKALAALNERTAKRIARGVEGQHIK